MRFQCTLPYMWPVLIINKVQVHYLLNWKIIIPPDLHLICINIQHNNVAGDTDTEFSHTFDIEISNYKAWPFLLSVSFFSFLHDK